VWTIEISQFSARNLKHQPSTELGALEVKFGPLPVSKPDYPSSYAKVITVLPKHVRVTVLEGRI
jgi:hypothetical protein